MFMAHALMENRNGLLVDFLVSEATGMAERGCGPRAAGAGARTRFPSRTLGGDKGYDTRGCVGAMRARGVTPHVAQNTSGRSSAIDGRTTRHRGYALSQRLRKRVEEIFGWMKDGGRVPEDALPRPGPHGPCWLPRGDSLQSGADGQADDC